MRESRLVVLGSSGFVGWQACEVAREQGISVVGLGSRDLNLLSKSAPRKLRKLLRAGDVVVHSAAIAPARNSQAVIRNLQMTQTLVDALARSPISKLVVVSSDAVYPDESSVVTESSAPAPDSFHGVMSLAREQICRTLDSISVAVLRPAPIYGVRDPHRSYGPNRFLHEAIAKKQITLFGSGLAKRDHIFIDDVAEAIVNVASTEASGTFNVASGVSLSFREIADLVADEFSGCSVRLEGGESNPTFRFFDITEYLGKVATTLPHSPYEGIRRLARSLLH